LVFLAIDNQDSSQIEALVAGGQSNAHAMLQVRPFKAYEQLLMGVGITTISWLLVSVLTPPSDWETLEKFYHRVKPGAIGWKRVIAYAEQQGRPISRQDRHSDLPKGILGMIFGCMAVYSALFATGYWIYGQYGEASFLTILSMITSAIVLWIWKSMNRENG
jgi:solute:Na+ symporter, SSS family